ncbi:hypothetical protein Cgig2_019015 [Carnegiea gigantea]|uniref:RRM domain-containing protein n=1 Tax=Carnegiea gigantea TaxID=171969 RepID=A0A9Q1GZ44_9CARY|nr:hypothetical protein Cgig2_019015 [Carnegiea gigantea]
MECKEQKEFSVFINNLPHDLDKHGLKGIFRRAGRVSDSYIAFRRSRRSSSRFGFVRFWDRGDSIKCILMFNNAIIREEKISVCMALYKKRRPNQPSEHQSKIIPDQESQSYNKLLIGQKVCTSNEPRDLATLASAITNGFCQCMKIYALSSFKFILTFGIAELIDETLRNHGELDLWFSEIKKRSRYECCETRKVWLEIYGVPPHGWLWENFSKIAEIWERLICLGKPIYRIESFESMKVQIITYIFRRIDEELLLTLEDRGYRVWIKEVGSAMLIPCSLAMENTYSNDEVLGFEI